MPEPIKYNLSEAALADGTIDFYTLLAEPATAETETLRSKIQTLYTESQANRDHRNLSKRREYQTLLELLPAARAALLEAPKREKYDRYLAAARTGTAETDFETFINNLMGFNDEMEEKTGLLGVQEKMPTATVQTIPAPSNNSRSAPAPRPNHTPARTVSTSSSAPSGVPARNQPAPPGASVSPNAIIGGLGGLALGFVIGFLASQHQVVPSILLGIIVGAIGFVALNRQPKQPIGR